MGVEILEVKSKSDLKKFINFPHKLFKGNQYWVPPLQFDEFNTLLKEKNPAFDFCEARYWLAMKNKKIVGRIAGIINHKYNEIWKRRDIRFGWVDFIDDLEVSSQLFKQVEEWGKEKGCDTINGPLGFTDMDKEGMLIEGFNEISTLATIYNYPYYHTHILQEGFEKDIDWVEFEVVAPKVIPEKVERIAQTVAKRYNLKTLKVKKAKELLPYAHEIFDVLNVAYKDLYGFVPLTEKQINLYVKQYFGFIKPNFVPVVLDSNGKVAAFGITMPSLSRALQKAKGKLFPLGLFYILKAMKKNNKVDLYLTAVRPDMQEKGVNAILMYEINKIYVENNIELAETNVELETNLKVQAQWRFYENRQHKRRRCFKKEL